MRSRNWPPATIRSNREWYEAGYREGLEPDGKIYNCPSDKLHEIIWWVLGFQDAKATRDIVASGP